MCIAHKRDILKRLLAYGLLQIGDAQESGFVDVGEARLGACADDVGLAAVCRRLTVRDPGVVDSDEIKTIIRIIITYNSIHFLQLYTTVYCFINLKRLHIVTKR